MIGDNSRHIQGHQTHSDIERNINDVQICSDPLRYWILCTDAGNAGISRSGTLAMVIGIPLRYCHGSWSLVDTRDLDHTIELVVQLAKALTKERMEAFTAY